MCIASASRSASTPMRGIGHVPGTQAVMASKIKTRGYGLRGEWISLSTIIAMLQTTRQPPLNAIPAWGRHYARPGTRFCFPYVNGVVEAHISGGAVPAGTCGE